MSRKAFVPTCTRHEATHARSAQGIWLTGQPWTTRTHLASVGGSHTPHTRGRWRPCLPVARSGRSRTGERKSLSRQTSANRDDVQMRRFWPNMHGLWCQRGWSHSRVAAARSGRTVRGIPDYVVRQGNPLCAHAGIPWLTVYTQQPRCWAIRTGGNIECWPATCGHDTA